MPLSDEQKRKMAEGRTRAALRRREAKAIKPADLPPGHERDEALKVVADHLEERMETEAAEVGIEAIDTHKLDERDNEIMQHVGPGGSVPFTGALPQYKYAWVTHEQAVGEGTGRAAIRAIHAQLKNAGYYPVQDMDPEAREFAGKGYCSGTTLRGVGDTMLWRIHRDNLAKQEERNKRRSDAQGEVEDRIFLMTAMKNGYPDHAHAASGNLNNDPMMAQRFSPDLRGPVTVRRAFDEGDLRRGSIKGYPAPGGQR